MKKMLLFFIAFLCTQSLSAQAMTETDSAFIRNHYSKQEIYIRMRDGVQLFTAIYTPLDMSKKYLN